MSSAGYGMLPWKRCHCHFSYSCSSSGITKNNCWRAYSCLCRNVSFIVVEPRQMDPPSKKRKGLRLSENESTPKKLKSVEPDLTVVAGGEEFYHCKVILCSGCDVTIPCCLLSVKMRENDESRIVFPDKDPTEWLQVYSFLDPTRKSQQLQRKMLWSSQCGLITWEMDELAKKCDEVYSQNVVATSDLDHFIQAWWNRCRATLAPYHTQRFCKTLSVSLESSHWIFSTIIARGWHECGGSGKVSWKRWS